MSGPMNVPWLAPGASEEDFSKALYALHCQVIETLSGIIETQCGDDSEGAQDAYLAWLVEMFARSLSITVPSIMAIALASGATRDDLTEMFAMSTEELDAQFPGLDRLLEAQLLANTTGHDVEVTIPTRDLGEMTYPMRPTGGQA